MLVLSRRKEEGIVIGDNIVVTILSVSGEKVKIGITAPKEIVILRQELWQAIQEQERIAEKLAAEPEPEGFDELRKLLADEAGADQ